MSDPVLAPRAPTRQRWRLGRVRVRWTTGPRSGSAQAVVIRLARREAGGSTPTSVRVDIAGGVSLPKDIGVAGHCLSLVVGQFENLGHSARASDVR